MALADGRVFVMTNLGLLAAIDPVDGRPIWCSLYSRAKHPTAGDTLQTQQTDGADPAASHHPWSANPIFVRKGNVFFLPSDTDQLFICDAQSGAPGASLPLSDWQNACTLLGIKGTGDDELGTTGDSVIVCSDKKVLAIDWQKAVAGGSADQATRWSADIAFDDDASICGRGVVTSDSVLVPTTQRLVRIVNGRIRATYPARGSFGEDCVRGNLLAASKQVLVAGQAGVDIYSGGSAIKGN
jgi:outer membrane protein assembly factor BamB